MLAAQRTAWQHESSAGSQAGIPPGPGGTHPLDWPATSNRRYLTGKRLLCIGEKY